MKIGEFILSLGLSSPSHPASLPSFKILRILYFSHNHNHFDFDQQCIIYVCFTLDDVLTPHWLKVNLSVGYNMYLAHSVIVTKNTNPK